MGHSFVLTPKAVKALACPKGKRVAYFRVLTDLHLFVQVTQAGVKTLVYRRFLNGTWRQMQVADWSTGLDESLGREVLRSASAKAAVLHAAIARGDNPFDLAKAGRTEPTLRELFDHYRAGHLQKRAKRVSDAMNDFDRWFGTLGHKKVSAFTYADAHRFHARLSTKTPISANRAVQFGRAMFNFGLKTRFIAGDNPFTAVSLNKEAQRDRVLSDDEAGKLLAALDKIPATHSGERTLRDWVLMSLFTGARKANILSMRWDEIDLDTCTWIIPAAKMKTGQSQILPLGPLELSVLTDRRQLLKNAKIVSPWVFPGAGNSGHIVDPGNAWEKLRERLGMEDLWIHDLRRSLASSMANTGADVSIVRAALNHADLRTTLKAYIRTSQQVQLQARQKAQAGWLEAMKRHPALDPFELTNANNHESARANQKNVVAMTAGKRRGRPPKKGLE